MSLGLNNYSTGDVLTADQLNADNTAIQNKFDSLGVNDLAEKYAIVAYPFYFPEIATTDTRQFKIRINTDSIITKLDFSVVSRSGGSDNLTLIVQKADDHTTFASATQIFTDTETLFSGYGGMSTFSASSFLAGSENLSTNNYVVFTLGSDGSNGSITTFKNINVTLTIKTLLQA